MERTKLLTGAVIGLFLLNLVTIGFFLFGPGREGHIGPPGGRGEGTPAQIIIERLHFDAQQVKQYRQLVREHQEQTRTLNDKSLQLYRTYYGLLESEKPDTAQANFLSGQIAQTQQALAQLNFRHFDQIKALCRSDQQADFTRLVSDLAQLFGRQHGPRRPNGEAPSDSPPQDGPPGPPEGKPGDLPPRP